MRTISALVIPNAKSPRWKNTLFNQELFHSIQRLSVLVTVEDEVSVPTSRVNDESTAVSGSGGKLVESLDTDIRRDSVRRAVENQRRRQSASNVVDG